MKVVAKVPAISASPPKLGGFPAPGAGIQRELVKNVIQSSFGTIGAACWKMNRKIATMLTMLLQPHRRMIHSVGFSRKSKTLNLRRAPGAAPGGVVVVAPAAANARGASLRRPAADGASVEELIGFTDTRDETSR